ncbi:serine/threonine-protein kinase EDR1 isoform X2 [Impatiens glandulifera]|uniref:serine/threonine-protein kinase EDR1 isoform X2 n=1 Tax=Impatiens glandulifera TaxID=253017 RepID=UPI001FB11816|nr:serine/threonine-protein kinase EDR1 isoform X2 [Impatiens glandulifera]
MKHIFKKLHKGTNHDPNRSNDPPATTSVSPSSTSDSRPVSGQSSSQSPVSLSSGAATETSPSPQLAVSAVNRQDYYSSEEDYQLQLALALSVSGPESRQDPENDQLHSATLLSLERHRTDTVRERDDAADLLSRQYWEYGVLDYEEKVLDGFYDVYALSPESSLHGKMPSVADLETNPGTSGFQAIIVNCRIDRCLEELLQIAHCISLDCPAVNVSILVQRLAELVIENMGGPVKDANIILGRWIERSTYLRTSLHTSVLPIGSLKIGLLRHRALLFKVFADYIGLPCRLIKGSHFAGIEDDAVNIIKMGNESEFLVDLMGDPGTLIPAADVFQTKDIALKSYNPKSSKLPNLLTNQGSGEPYPPQKPLFGYSESSSGLYVGGNHSSEEKLDNKATGSTANNIIGIGPSGTNKPASSSLSDHHSLAIGTSMNKETRVPNAVATASRMNMNVVPHMQNSSEDPKNLFADLNPFQIKGSGKPSVQNNPFWSKNGEFQRESYDLVSGRPHAPLIWKNRQACNDIPRKNESDFVERKNQQKVGNLASSAFTTSSALDVNPTRNDISIGISLVSPSDNQFTKSTCEDERNIHHREDYLQNGEDQQNNAGNVKQHGKNMDRVYDFWNSTQDTHREADLKLKGKGTENPSSATVFSGVQADPLDDVGECEIPWEHLVIGERIGLGSYGEVYRADWNGTEVAVKKFLDQDFSGAALAEFRREVRIMRRLRHANVVQFMGAVTRPPNLSIVTEFLPRGSLYRIIHRPDCHIDEKRRIKMALDVAKGMNCLHTSTPTIVHRDLKSPNLLVDNYWNVKVGDFGLSRLKHNTFLSSKSTAGTPEWMAPEVLRNEPSNEKCDVYSFGVILWELATLRLPWTGMNPMQVVGAVGFQNRHLEIPKEVDPLVARIILQCCQTDPSLRPSFAELTVALKSLQHLVNPSSQFDQQSSQQITQEISVNSTP